MVRKLKIIEKCERHTIVREIGGETLKTNKKREIHIVVPGIWGEI